MIRLKNLIVPVTTLTLSMCMSAMVYANVPTTSQNVNDELVVVSGSDAPDPIVKDWDYEDTGDEIIINRYKGTKENVTVPEEINGKPVVELANSVFSGLGVKKVTIPDSVEIMGDNIFRDCTRLESVKLSNSITELHGYVFGGCENLKEIILPEELMYFDSTIFQGTNIEYLNIPKNVADISVDDSGLMPKTIKKYTVDEENNFFAEENGMVLSKDKSILYFCPKNIGDDYTYIEIPDSVSTIFTLTELPNKKNVNIFIGDNVNEIVFDRNNSRIWAEPGSYIHEYIKVQLNQDVNLITKKGFQKMKESDFWFGYSNETNGLVVLNYTGNNNHIEIPSYIDEVKVTEFTRDIFEYASTVTIPETFKKIYSDVYYEKDYSSVISNNKKLTKIINNSDIELPLDDFSNNYFGWAKDIIGESGILDHIPAKSTVYRITISPYHDYFMEVINVCDKLEETGINELNAPNSNLAVKYVYDLIPKYKNKKLNLVVGIFENTSNHFKPVEGNRPGRLEVQVRIYEGSIKRFDLNYRFRINPDKNTGGSSGGSSSGGSSSGDGSSSDRDEGNKSSSYRHKDVKLNNTSENKTGNWTQNEKGWWFQYKDGTWPSNEWVYLPWGDGYNWYFFDTNGYMSSGWVLWNGHYYYMNGNSDGNKGAMLTGWQFIDGKWYYLESNITSKYGAMYKNRRTPDGYYVGDDGAWVQ